MPASHPPGFHGTPVSQMICICTIVLPLTASILKSKYWFLLEYSPFIAEYFQIWRLVTFQLAFVNETDVMLGLVLFYQFRSLERLFGGRKYLSYIVLFYVYSIVLVTVLLVAVNASGYLLWNHVASGPVSIMCGLFVLYKQYIPRIYRFQIEVTASQMISLDDQFLLSAVMLVLLAANGVSSLALAAIGYTVAVCLDRGILPGKYWRLPFYAPPLQTQPYDAESTQDVPQRSLGTQFLDNFRT